MMVNGEMRQEGLNLLGSHFVGMELIVKQDIAPNPITIRLFCATRIVLDADCIADLVEEFLWLWGYRIIPVHVFLLLPFAQVASCAGFFLDTPMWVVAHMPMPVFHSPKHLSSILKEVSSLFVTLNENSKNTTSRTTWNKEARTAIR